MYGILDVAICVFCYWVAWIVIMGAVALGVVAISIKRSGKKILHGTTPQGKIRAVR